VQRRSAQRVSRARWLVPRLVDQSVSGRRPAGRKVRGHRFGPATITLTDTAPISSRAISNAWPDLELVALNWTAAVSGSVGTGTGTGVGVGTGVSIGVGVGVGLEWSITSIET